MHRALLNMNKTGSKEGIRHYDVLVIGTGISGLACASRLLKNDQFSRSKRLLVLEGRNRIGGRIEAVTVNRHRLDTGANWIHGIGTKDDPNPLLTVLPHQRYKVLAGSVAFGPSRLDSNGGGQSDPHHGKQKDQVIPSKIAGTLSAGVWGTIESLHDMAKSMSLEEAKSTTVLQSIVNSKPFQDTYSNLPQEYHSTFGSMLQFVENIEAGPLSGQFFERPEGKPGMSMLEYANHDYEGEQWFLQDGFISIINELAKELLKQDSIQLNTVVNQIDYSSSPITIRTNQGNFTANDVVCTIPLGVLKDQGKDLFVPELPRDKSDAISRLGFGTLDKIFLVYEKAWWAMEPYKSILKKGLTEISEGCDPATVEPDIFAGSTDELPGFEIRADGTIGSACKIFDIINLHSLIGIPVLSCFVSCSTAVTIEAMTDEQAAGIVHRSMTRWYGQEPPQPTAVHVTRWAQDDLSRGSYTHMIAGLSEAVHREAFKQPIAIGKKTNLRFAGEHTSRNHYAVAHGALTSGWREADKILMNVSKN